MEKCAWMFTIIVLHTYSPFLLPNLRLSTAARLWMTDLPSSQMIPSVIAWLTSLQSVEMEQKAQNKVNIHEINVLKGTLLKEDVWHLIRLLFH